MSPMHVSAGPQPLTAVFDDAVRLGDRSAFRHLFDEYWAGLQRYARSLVSDSGAADDVVQEAFVRLWDRREAIAKDIPLHAWLYRTVRNLALNERRDTATRARLLADPFAVDSAAAPRPAAAPDADAAGQDLAAQLELLMAELPPRQREALVLSREQGLSHADVATAMGCSPRTVNNHLVAALATLRRRLTDAGTLVATLAWWIIQ